MSPRHANKREREIHALEKLAAATRDINQNSVSFDVGEVGSEAYGTYESTKEDYFESVIRTEINNYVWNHEENTQKIITNDSIDETTFILDNVQEYIFEPFGMYKPNKMTYDELQKRVIEEAKKVSEGQYGPEFTFPN